MSKEASRSALRGSIRQQAVDLGLAKSNKAGGLELKRRRKMVVADVHSFAMFNLCSILFFGGGWCFLIHNGSAPGRGWSRAS